MVAALALGAGCKRAPRRAGPSASPVARWAEAEGPLCNPQGMCWHWPQPAGDLEGIWAASPEQAWVVGRQGLLAHHVEGAWRPVHTDVTSDLTAVWGASASDVWAVGDVGVILRWDGKLWTRPRFTVPRGLLRADLAMDLTALWGVSASEVWIACRYGAPLFWDGKQLTPLGDDGELEQLGEVRGIWASARFDVWLVGDGVAHWDGQRWTVGGPEVPLRAVWGSGPRDVWAVSTQTVHHFDGAVWSEVHTLEAPTGGLRPRATELTTLRGSGPNSLLIGTDLGVAHWGDDSWIDVARRLDVRALALAADGDAWVAGWSGAGRTNVSVDMTTLRAPRAAWSDGADALFVVAASGVARRDGGARWADVPTEASVRAIWAASTDDIWAVGDGIAHGDAGGLATVKAEGSWHTIWGNARDDIWVGGAGALQHWDGSSWSTAPGADAFMLLASWGRARDDVWMAGIDGVALHWDGSTWTRTETGVTSNLLSLWGSARDDVWAAGEAGVLLHWDGQRWSEFPSGTRKPLNSLWGRSPTDIWASTGTRGALHWDGRVWSTVDLGVDDIGVLTGTSAGELWLLADGAALHGRPRIPAR